ncbi:MAG: penicillin-binding protein 2, partial [Candidatus Omnitrophica bacterium]|nr:penicillin-binding protein 2 [Candidatus Omnitrophota bacterium]
MRVKAVVVLLITGLLILSAGLVNLQVIQYKKLKEFSDKNCIRLIPQQGCRGKILDRNNKVIVDSRISYDLLLVPQRGVSAELSLSKISKILGVDFKKLKSTYNNGYIAPFVPITIASDIGLHQAIALEELKSDMPDIVVQPHPLRHYPYDTLASQTIGYLGEIDHWRLSKLADYGYQTKDVVGFGGIEEKYDYYLRYEEGALSVEVDHRGRFIRTIGFKPPQDGRDISLTLDLEMQKAAEAAMKDRRGSVVIMDASDGGILAMVSSPNYNPASFIDKDRSCVSDIFSDPQSPLLNRAIGAKYPPASVFKLVIAAGALDTKKINLSTTFLCTGSTRVGNRNFACWDTHGQQDVIGAIAHSCDVFFYKTGLLLGPDAMHDYALKFGLSKPTNIDLPYEANGFVPSRAWRKLSKFQNWFDGDTANFAIGQGELMVTPVQMARLMGVFATDGFLLNPHIVKAVDGNPVYVVPRKLSRLNMKPAILNSIKQGLRKVVSDPKGTASSLAA